MFDGNFVFGEVTRLSHSCDANCNYHISGDICSCFANRFIQAGDELTISYNSERDKEPIHERRRMYLEKKEFTCHCSRCDAPGDDTRQFDCCDPKCNGVMLACQPISQKPIEQADLAYTGVEYVEPHLLPCTVCHRTAPASYQAEMFELENKMSELSEKYDSVVNGYLINGYTADTVNALLAEILGYRFPMRHAQALPILSALFKLRLCSNVQASRSLQTQQAAMQYIQASESIFHHAHGLVLSALYAVCGICIRTRPGIVFTVQQEKDLSQRALRMHMILNGREERDALLEEVVSNVLSRLPLSPPDTEVCAFCGESPLRVALTLSRCGRCRQVAYCSVGCQKAHWKLHKTGCKANTKAK